MKFFNIDLHISVIADLKYIFEKLGHQVTNTTLSGHSWVFDRPVDHPDIISSKNWTEISEEMCDKFYDRYKDELSGYDAFIVTHTPCFSLLYRKFNKPIIVVASTRYEEPFGQDHNRWEWFNNYLIDMIDRKQIIPVANNRYDAAYCELFTKRTWKHIPSLCEYTKMKYSGEKSTFLLATNFPVAFDWEGIKRKDEVLPSPYKWNDLAAYRGILHIPYNCSTMSIFEEYTANIPLVFPTHRLFMELYKSYPRHGILSQLSWNQVRGRVPGSIIPIKDGQYDPNQYDSVNSMSAWMKLADYYDREWMPYITYFDSLQDIRKIIEKMDLLDISKSMEIFNRTRKERVYDSWKKILSDLQI